MLRLAARSVNAEDTTPICRLHLNLLLSFLALKNLSERADLSRKRNEVDAEIARVIGRPAVLGHVGEYIAAEVFGIVLESSATSKAIDG